MLSLFKVDQKRRGALEVSWVKRLQGMRLVRWCDGAMAERHKLVTRMINEEEEEGEARAKPVSRGRNFGPTREGRKCRIIMKEVRGKKKRWIIEGEERAASV